MPLYPPPSSGGAAVIVEDEGVVLTPTVASIDFVGAGVTASAVGNDVTVTIPGGGGGGGSFTQGTATLDFGAFPGSNEATVVVTGQAAIGATPIILLFVSGDDTTVDHDENDHNYFASVVGLTPSDVVAGDRFTINAVCDDALMGTFDVRWAWSN